MTECVKWLKNFLVKNGFGESSYVSKKARITGFSRAELKTARKELGVKTVHQIDNDGYEKIENWFWYLPEVV